MQWRIKHIFNLAPERPWQHGFVNFGFHGREGTQYFLHYNEHWLGCITAEDEFVWTAGAVDKGLSPNHIPFAVKHPHYINELPDGSLLVSSNGTNEIFRVWPDDKSAQLFVDTGSVGLKDIGNCVYDDRGSLWVHEIEGCRVWQFDWSGEPIQVLGNGKPGFQKGTVPFAEVQFNWIYDLRMGPDGSVYVLDSKNFCVRRIDSERGTVSVVAGTGEPGYSGDGGPALEATLGSDPSAHFDGPFSLSLDEEGNIFIGDTYNHVVRMVERASGHISTIAGRHPAEPGRRNDPLETDPLSLNLPKICSMDYYGGCLFVPDWSDDLIVLEKST
ncbi:MAG: hypothetical protein JSW37_06085 [Anaerolineales bacterium]|nr:MAG: hypothetical protein JSW37_06085 [Anaerolineales bacterium]